MNRRAVISMCVLTLLCASAAQAQAGDGPGSGSVRLFSAPQWYQRYRPDTQSPMPHTPPAARQAATPDLTVDRVAYHGGGVMQGYKAYTIFWAPGTHSIPLMYQTLINRWFDDVGGSSLLNIATQYFQFSLPTYPFATVQNVSSLGGTWLDSAKPYPHAGTAADPLLDDDIQAEVQRAITMNAWPKGGSDVEYLVYTASGVESCFSASKTTCTPGVPGVSASQQYLGYHSSFGPSSPSQTIYANMPYAATWVSLVNFTSPNGAPDADLEIDVTSHEQFESITDPAGVAWFSDLDGEEIADKCASSFGPGAADGSNVILNGNPYVVQGEWSNAQAGCALGMLCGGQPQTSCRTPTKSGASLFQLKVNAAAKRNTLTWKWNKGAATSLADFGDPLTATTYGVCVYDETDGNPILLIDVAAGPGSGWVQTATGFKYTNKTPPGNQPRQITLRAGAAGKAKISVSAKGEGLPIPELPLEQAPKVIVQLQNSAGACWEAEYSSATKSSSTQFKAKSD
jgi:hypothetical protein